MVEQAAGGGCGSLPRAVTYGERFPRAEVVLPASGHPPACRTRVEQRFGLVPPQRVVLRRCPVRLRRREIERDGVADRGKRGLINNKRDEGIRYEFPRPSIFQFPYNFPGNLLPIS